MELSHQAMLNGREEKVQRLYTFVVRRKWMEVIKMLEEDPTLHRVRFRDLSGNTALQIAVSDGDEEIVNLILGQCSLEDRKEVVKISNIRGNTALHLAAELRRNVRICRKIAGLEPELVDRRNVNGETPLFLTSLSGNKDAFLLLHNIQNPGSSCPFANCRRNNGDTILHCAITGDYFDLAFQIIHLHEELVNWMNEDGLSPLHLLAMKPSVFRSGSHLRLTETIIYHCITIEKLKVHSPTTFEERSYPNAVRYTSWNNVFCLLKPVVDKFVRRDEVEANVEDPREVANSGNGELQAEGGRTNRLFPANYRACCDLIKFFHLLLMIMLWILGKAYDYNKLKREKEIHTWSFQIVRELLCRVSLYEYKHNGRQPFDSYAFDDYEVFTRPHSIKDKKTTETAILLAARNGLTEIVDKILEVFPVAINDENEDKKNIVLLAVEHRQPHVYLSLWEKVIHNNNYTESIFSQVDKEGNSALHLAATLGSYKPSLIPGEALQMQWELKWYEFVKNSMPPGFFPRHNSKCETPEEIFTKAHKDLVKSGGDWLNKGAESCSVVAALVATVAFATSATMPGGVHQDSGYPVLKKEPAFQVFATSSLIALCCSIVAVVMFLSLLTSRFQQQDFDSILPKKLLAGLTLLLMSIASMLVSFCAGHFFLLKDQLHHAALPLYVVTCLFVTYLVLAQFPLYFDFQRVFQRATFFRVLQRGYRAT